MAIHLGKLQLQYLKRLLDMMYRPSELAEQLGVDVRTVYKSYVEAGCPCVKEKNGRLWINGAQFREWALAHRGKAPSRTEQSKQAARAVYCVRCKQSFYLPSAALTFYKTINSGVQMFQAACPGCGKPVYQLIGKGSVSP